MDFRVDTTPITAEVNTDTEEGRRFRQEVRDFLDKELTPEVRRESELQRDQYYDFNPIVEEFQRKLAGKGWTAPLAPAWPREYGGVARSEVETRILAEELTAHGVSAVLTLGELVAPLILRYGSEEMKREFLPKMACREVTLAEGYTEPNAGTDLASLETRAVRDGNDYIINGQKVYSTGANYATHHWLAARTNSAVEKHRGISLFIVDLRSPGITIKPLWMMDGERTNEVFYDDVRVPRKNLVGEENQGWTYIRETLAVERVELGSAGGGSNVPTVKDVLDELIEYARETKRNGEPLAKDPLVRQSLAQLAIETRIRRLFGYRTEWLLSQGIIPVVEAAMQKVWGNELDQRIANVGTQLLGLYGQLEPSAKWAPLRGRIEHRYLFTVNMSYAGGSHELMRSLMAIRGMGLPREP
ncbi:MAG: acyl-CoA dehydrogenase family protein [Chloroflexi bacterium]|nr:acyl-CoA dehydrogenase family protein [Chloroflexota bacterium]